MPLRGRWRRDGEGRREIGDRPPTVVQRVLDEGVDTVLDTLKDRVGVNVLMLGTVSWLGLKTGRSISHKLDGWPDHGVPEPFAMKGGAYFEPDPRYYNGTFEPYAIKKAAKPLVVGT